MTDVNVEVGVVDVQSVGCLLEVNVRNAIGTNVVVLDKAKCSTRSLVFHDSGRSVDIVSPLVKDQTVNAGLSHRGIDVLAQRRQSEGIDIDRTALHTGSCFRCWVTADVGRRRKDAGGHKKATHLNEGGGSWSLKNDLLVYDA